jgi:hypothetical protein
VSGFVAGHAWEGLAKESPVAQMAVLFVAALLHNLIFLTLYTWAQIGEMPALMLRTGAPGALYTAVTAPLIMALLERALHFRISFNGTRRRHK